MSRSCGRSTRTDRVEIEVDIPDEPYRDLVREACGGDERWLYGATVPGSRMIWLLGGPEDTPYYSTSKHERVCDVISHESMHVVLTHLEDESVSDQYDDLIRDGLDYTTYLHYYARGGR